MNTQKKSKIIDILYGKYNYSEKFELDEESNAFKLQSWDIEGDILDKLKSNAELTALFEKYVECESVANIAENDVHFSEGFKTGLIIGLEAGEWLSKK